MLYLLFLKSLLRRKAVWFLMMTAAVCSCLCLSVRQLRQDLPSGIFSEDPGNRAVLEYCVEWGFVECTSEAELKTLIQRGELDCGFILPADFTERMENGNLRDSVELLTTVRSGRENTFSTVVFGAIFREYTPYLASAVVASLGYEVKADDLSREMERVELQELTFEISQLSRLPDAESVDSGLVMGLLAMLGFALTGFSTLELAGKSAQEVKCRFSRPRWLITAVFPQTLSLSLLMLFGSWVGIIVGQVLFSAALPGLFAAMTGYFLFLGLCFGFFLALPLKRWTRYGLLTLEILLTVVFCPLYWDVALVIPGCSIFRWLVAPCWFYQMFNHSVLTWAAIFAAVVFVYCSGKKRF